MAQQPSYMAVPEKIELTGNSGVMGYPLPRYPQDDPTYKSMKIPDTITLDTASPVDRGMSGGREGGVGNERDSAAQSNERREREARKVQPTTTENIPREKIIPNMSSGGLEGIHHQQQQQTSPDIEKRVRILESKVKTLTETILSQQYNGPSSVQRGNGFWYVMTFAGWMMVPLIMVFMYQYKKNN